MNRMQKIFKPIDFPPLTDEQKKELEALRNMDDSEIDFSDAPKCDFEKGEFYYLQSSVPRLDIDNFNWISSYGGDVQKKLNAIIHWARENNCPAEKIG